MWISTRCATSAAFVVLAVALGAAAAPWRPAAAQAVTPSQASAPGGNPATLLWYTKPAEKWDDALPVGNGRLGAMVFGRTDEELIQINDDTYWSGGPYSTTVKGGHEALPEIRRLIFSGRLVEAHKLFGRHLLGRPVEQQKYQALGSISLSFAGAGGTAGAYRHQLDLDTAVVTTTYEQGGTAFVREVFSSPVDQVLVVRITADRPGQVRFRAQLRGARNTAHSNYATDYFQMDGDGADAVVLRGKSADYMGVTGALRYEARMKAVAESGRVSVSGDTLVVDGADAVTLLVAAATSFVSFQDVSGDPAGRVAAVMAKAAARPFADMRSAHVAEHQRLFRRVAIDLGATADSALPTDERLKKFDGANDPALAALLFQFGRYLLISASRPGTQPANLQGIWNASMNPPWDSKYTTNINTQMNYWPAEVANLPETAEPLFGLIRDLTAQGSDVAREHYGARGWVAHQNTDLWRVAAPMDGPSWGGFTTGGAWLVTHLWEHYRFTGDVDFLREYYPVMKGSAEFFLDFLVEHPARGWLVTNPSTSPENFPLAPGNDRFFDEITTFMSAGTSLVAGSTIDMQILNDLFGYVADASRILEADPGLRAKLLEARARLAPMQIGRKGDLQEWLEDWDQREKSHRHISHLYGLYPGHQITPRRTPEFADGSRRVLEQRGLEGNGWASAWKAAAWARLGDPQKALDNIVFASRTYTTKSLFSICSGNPQVDGAFGMTAAIAEMLVQSHEDAIALLPVLAPAWKAGQTRGLRARGGFEIDMRWSNAALDEATVTSTRGGVCRIRSGEALSVTSGARGVTVRRPRPDVVEFDTTKGATYTLRPAVR